MGFDHLKRCFELADADVVDAVETRATTKELLDHLSSIARPNDGAPKILLVFARMATSACEWLDGDLRVEIVGDGDVSVVEVMTELGADLRERALPSFAVPVPLAEFIRAVERVPKMVEPLAIKTKTETRIVLAAALDVRMGSLPPPPIAIAEDHLIDPNAPPPAFAQPPPMALPDMPAPLPAKAPKPPPSAPKTVPGGRPIAAIKLAKGTPNFPKVSPPINFPESATKAAEPAEPPAVVPEVSPGPEPLPSPPPAAPPAAATALSPPMGAAAAAPAVAPPLPAPAAPEPPPPLPAKAPPPVPKAPASAPKPPPPKPSAAKPAPPREPPKLPPRPGPPRPAVKPSPPAAPLAAEPPPVQAAPLVPDEKKEDATAEDVAKAPAIGVDKGWDG